MESFAVSMGGVRLRSQGFCRFSQQCATRRAQCSALGEHRPAYRRWSYTICRIADPLSTVLSADSSQVRRWQGESVCARVEPTLCTTGDPPRNCAAADRSITVLHSRATRCCPELRDIQICSVSRTCSILTAGSLTAGPLQNTTLQDLRTQYRRIQ